MSNKNLTPTPIVDKNGKNTTVLKRTASAASELKRVPAPKLQKTMMPVSGHTPDMNRAALEALRTDGFLHVDKESIESLMKVSPKVVEDVIDAVAGSNLNEQKVWDYALVTYSGQENLEKREVAYRTMLKWLPTITAATMKEGNERPGLYFHTKLKEIGQLKNCLPKDDSTPMDQLLPAVDWLHQLRFHAGYHDDVGTDVSAETIDDIVIIAQHLDKVEQFFDHLAARKIWMGEDIRSFLELENDLNATPALSEGVL